MTEVGWPLRSPAAAYDAVTTRLVKDAAMAAAVLRMGRSDDLLHPPMSVDWPDDHGGGCRLVAECEFHPALTIVAVAERIAEAVVA